MNSVGLIILAAGEGKRMKSKNMNKVALTIEGKSLISRIVEQGEKLNLSPIVVVVGYAKESVISALNGHTVSFATQEERAGTALAVSTGLYKFSSSIKNIMVLNGDDAFFLTEEVLRKLIETHTNSHASLTMLTMHLDNPLGIGRVVRDQNNNILKVVEEKDATDDEKKIHEVNGIGYIFKRAYLEANLPKVPKSYVTGEYYLTSLVEIASSINEKIASVLLGKIPWRGVNTEEDLHLAKQLFKSVSN